MSQLKNEHSFHSQNIQFSSTLREGKAGEFEGKPQEVFLKAFEEAKVEMRLFRPLNGENGEDILKRANNFIHNDILQKYFLCSRMSNKQTSNFDYELQQIKPKKLDFLIVSHAGFINEFTNAISYLKDKTPPLNKGTKNTSISKFKLTQDISNIRGEVPPIKFDIIVKNDHEHINMTFDQIKQKFST